jgi:hypothetical protein
MCWGFVNPVRFPSLWLLSRSRSQRTEGQQRIHFLGASRAERPREKTRDAEMEYSYSSNRDGQETCEVVLKRGVHGSRTVTSPSRRASRHACRCSRRCCSWQTISGSSASAGRKPCFSIHFPYAFRLTMVEESLRISCRDDIRLVFPEAIQVVFRHCNELGGRRIRKASSVQGSIRA